VRSYWVEDSLSLILRDGELLAWAGSGRLHFSAYAIDPFIPLELTHKAFRLDSLDESAAFDVTLHGLVRHVRFPLWLPALLFALAPAWWVVGPWRTLARRRKLGLCEQCGYDLRATPGRCPECGKEKDEG
jgi:hypothetical protein